jgi:cytochrome P450
MVQYWGSKASVTTVADDARTLSLHVLSRVGFGKGYPFQGHDDRSTTSVASNYKESLQTILDNCVLLFAMGTEFIKKPWLPNRLRKLNLAVINFKKYMTDVYESEKAAVAAGIPTENNLMTNIVRASLEGDGLTETEIYGNIFVFNFAGHDTTAHTFAFTTVLMATAPHVQDWLAEELNHIFGDRSYEEWNYATDFPKLTRTYSLLLETIRLYTPVPIAKSTGKEDRPLRVGDKTYILPENTLIIPNHVAVHTHPKFWGNDSMEWKPQRWVKLSGSQSIGEEEIMTPQKGSFIPWSDGIRVCPGKKFSQVEFVAAMAAVFKDWYVEPVLLANENMEQARKRVLRLVEEDTGQVLLLQMLHPERAPLRWKRKVGSK